MKDILEKVAEKNGITRDEVESEIQKAIKEAMKAGSRKLKDFGKKYLLMDKYLQWKNGYCFNSRTSE